MDERSREILAQYTADALTILDHSIALSENGHESFYRVVAVQLRILLCDTNFRHGKTEEIAVIPLLFPRLTLHPIDSLGLPLKHLLSIDLKTWLDLPAGSDSELTTRQLIRRVCDIDGGAHVDIKPLAGLPENGNTRQWIINLAKYISPIIGEALRQRSGLPLSN
ncbi:MAG: hypothetical protein AB9897_04450 [Anaerolineaceae bacterium]